MVRIRSSIILGFIFFSGIVTAQEFIKSNLLRASASFSIGKLTADKESTINIGSSLEYYLDERFSLRGEGVYFIGYNDNIPVGYKSNHGLMAGISYHFTEKKAFDPYIGLQPGMSFGKYGNLTDSTMVSDTYWLSNNRYTNFHVNPTVSVHTGFNYYAEKFFHLFVDLRYLYGNFHSEIPTRSLNEIRIEFGLGFNFGLKLPSCNCHGS